MTEQRPTTDELPHPMQPVGWDGRGVVRFKRNAIVEYLLEHGGIDLNRIGILAAQGKFTDADQVQFAQLIGYSVSGFGDLSYVPDRVVRQAYRRMEKLVGAAKEEG